MSAEYPRIVAELADLAVTAEWQDDFEAGESYPDRRQLDGLILRARLLAPKVCVLCEANPCECEDEG